MYSQKIYAARWYQKNKSKVKSKSIIYYRTNLNKIKARLKANKDKISLYNKRYRQKHRDKLVANKREKWRLHGKEIYKAAKQQQYKYYLLNKKKIIIRCLNRAAKNKDKISLYHASYFAKKKFPDFPIAQQLQLAQYHRRKAIKQKQKG